MFFSRHPIFSFPVRIENFSSRQRLLSFLIYKVFVYSILNIVNNIFAGERLYFGNVASRIQKPENGGVSILKKKKLGFWSNLPWEMYLGLETVHRDLICSYS